MKRILIFLCLLWGTVQAQTIGQLRYDSVMLTKTGGNSELIILNGSRAVTGGVLTNTGNGRTAFVAPAGGIGTASNGLTKVGSDVKLGGTLTANTTINVDPYDLKLNLLGGNFILESDDTGHELFKINVQGETQPRFEMQTDGLMEWDNGVGGNWDFTIQNVGGQMNIESDSNLVYLTNQQGDSVGISLASYIGSGTIFNPKAEIYYKKSTNKFGFITGGTMQVSALPTTIDTSNFKPVSYNGTEFKKMTYWPSAGGSSGITVGTTTISSGTNKSVPFNDSGIYNEDAGFTYNKTGNKFTVDGVTENTNINTTGLWNQGQDIGSYFGDGTVALSIASSRTWLFNMYNAGAANKRMFLRGTGELGIGDFSPGTTNTVEIRTIDLNHPGLVVKGTTSQAVDIVQVQDVSSNPLFYVGSAGAIRFGTYGAGTITSDASGNLTSVSDVRLKNIRGSYSGGLKELMKIKPIVYKWNAKSGMETQHSYIGFSAQNINYALGEDATGRNAQGYMSIQDRAIMATMINAIQELKAEVDELKRQLHK